MVEGGGCCGLNREGEVVDNELLERIVWRLGFEACIAWYCVCHLIPIIRLYHFDDWSVFSLRCEFTLSLS